MITVIPMNDDRIANHFTRADSLLFIDAEGREISRHANPALEAECGGKQRLLDLIVRQGAERVVVRNIGRQMLDRLLEQNLIVLQTGRGHRHVADLSQFADLVALTDASQGRPSSHHDEQAGGCGCGHQHGHSHSHDAEHQCCGQHKGHQHHAHGRGHGRCCHS
jgi:predicted Fe-Mo cluster-binding NifX family protein